MKKLLLSCIVFLVSGLAQAAVAIPADSKSSPYLIGLAAVALIGTIARRRNSSKARS